MKSQHNGFKIAAPFEKIPYCRFRNWELRKEFVIDKQWKQYYGCYFYNPRQYEWVE